MKIFYIKENINKYDYIRLFCILILSIATSYLFVTQSLFSPKDIKFNVFEVIPLHVWILLIILNISILSIIRAFLLKLFSKKIISYQSILIHIIQYGLFAMPFLIGLILILANKYILDTFPQPINLENSLFFGIIYSLFFFFIWIMFLGATIKSSLLQNYKFIISLAITIGTSTVAIAISSCISFLSIISIEKYEVPVIIKILDTQVQMNLISENMKEDALKKYIEEKKGKSFR